MESYCGKNCVQCSYLNQGRCPGCKDGPGMPYTRACPLARCCQQKGHRGCYTCLFAENCHLLRQKDSLPSWRPTGTASLKISSPTPPPAKEQAELLLRGFCLLSLLEFLSFGWFFLIPPILSHSLSRGMLVSLAALSTLFFSLAYFYLNRAHTGYYIPGFRSSVSAANRISRHLYGGSGIRSKQCGIHDAGVYASVLPGRMGGLLFSPKCRCFPEPKPGQTLGYPVLFPSLSCLFQLNRLYELSCGSSNPGPHTPAVAAVSGAYEGFEADISHSDSCYTGPVPWGNEKRSPSSLTVRRFLFQMGSGPWVGQPLSFGTFRDTAPLSTDIFFPAPYSKNPIIFIIFGEVFIPWKAIAEKIVCSVPTLFSAAVPGVNGDLVSRCRGSVPWPGAVGKRDMEPAAPAPWRPWPPPPRSR